METPFYLLFRVHVSLFYTPAPGEE